MKNRPASELLLLEEMMKSAQTTRIATRGLTLGALIKLLRQQLGLSQRALAKRVSVPQSTVSRIEQSQSNVTLETLNTVLNGISCDLIIVPLMREPIETVRRRQAKKKATTRVLYLQGTMNLEAQEPDTRFVAKLIQQEEERLLHGPNARLWEENE